MTTDTDLSPRELDAALAERLFGWKSATDCGIDFKAWQKRFDTPPQLSTTGDGMLLVLEAMRERGFGWRAHGSLRHGFKFHFIRGGWRRGPLVENPGDFPRAVALAALVALETRQ